MLQEVIKTTLKRTLIIFLIIFGLGIIGAIDSFVGNPISKIAANKTANTYIHKEYENLDLFVESVDYNFEERNYKIKIHSKLDSQLEFLLFISNKSIFDSNRNKTYIINP